MKSFRKVTLILIAVLSIFSTQSCSEKKIEDDQLKGFMLGGIYFIHGFGGIQNVKNMMSSSGITSKAELAQAYKEVLEYPFKKEQASGCKNTLKSSWDITDKASLLKSINELKTKESKHKSWDYARIVNNVCMGYGAGYITKEEGIKIVKEILPIAQKEYATWEKYYTDYNLGRADWDPESKNDPFEKLSKEITKGDKSIYNILPLN